MISVSVGDEIVVSDPKHSDSTHEHSFSGTVIGFDASAVDVEDQDGNIFAIGYDEIYSTDH